jgi:hypothetical protein
MHRVVTKCAPGFIQVVPDAYSVDSLKKMHGVQTLGQVKPVAIAAVTSDACHKSIGLPLTHAILKVYTARFSDSSAARAAFVASMAAYSCCCMVLNIKDRHNGNILVDALGAFTSILFSHLFMLFSPQATLFTSILVFSWAMHRAQSALKRRRSNSVRCLPVVLYDVCAVIINLLPSVCRKWLI